MKRAVLFLLLAAAAPGLAAQGEPVDFEVLRGELADLGTIAEQRRRLMQLLVAQPAEGGTDADRLGDAYDTLKTLESSGDLENPDLTAWAAAALHPDERVRQGARIAALEGGARPLSDSELLQLAADQRAAELAAEAPEPAIDPASGSEDASLAVQWTWLPGPSVPEPPQPLPAPEGARSVALAKILGPTGARYAANDADPVVGALSVLDSAGYTTHGHPNPLFDLDDRDDAQVLLGGQVEEAHQVSLAADEPGWWLVVRWELLDVASKRVVYHTRTNGVARAKSEALDNSLRALLARPAFTEQILPQSADRVDDIDDPPLSFATSQVCVFNVQGPAVALQLDGSLAIALTRRRYLCLEAPPGYHQLKLPDSDASARFTTEADSIVVFEVAGTDKPTLSEQDPSEFDKRKQTLAQMSR